MNGLGFRDWPDRLFLPPHGKRSGRRFWAEFKRIGQDLTPSQEEMHADLKARGEEVYTVRTRDEFEKILKAHSSF